MKLHSDILFEATYAGGKNILKGKFTKLEYSIAEVKGGDNLPETITLPGIISVKGALESGLKTADLNHEVVGDLFSGILHGKLEFAEALPTEVDNVVIEIKDAIIRGAEKPVSISVTDDEIGAVVAGRLIHTLQSKKKPGSGTIVVQGRKKPGSGSDVAI